MKKIVAVLIIAFVITSCGTHPCPAYTSFNKKDDTKTDQDFNSTPSSNPEEIRI